MEFTRAFPLDHLVPLSEPVVGCPVVQVQETTAIPPFHRLRFATQNTGNAVKVSVIAQDLGRPTPFHVGDVIGMDVVNR